VMITDVSFPLTAMAVMPEPEMALKAYSTWKSCEREEYRAAQLEKAKILHREVGLLFLLGRRRSSI